MSNTYGTRDEVLLAVTVKYRKTRAIKRDFLIPLLLSTWESPRNFWNIVLFSWPYSLVKQVASELKKLIWIMIINRNDSYQWVHLPPDHLYTVYCKVRQEWLQNAIAFGVMVAVCDSFFFLIKCDKCLQRENVITECDRKYLEVRPRLTASRPLSIKTVSNDHKRTRVIVISLETLVLSLFLYTL